MPVQINRVYHQLYEVDARYRVTYGGRRSGKSVGVSQDLVRLGAENPGRRIGVLRKVGTSVRLSVWNRMRNAIDEAVGLSRCRENKTDREIELPNGSIFDFFGLDDPEKTKSLEDFTDFWLEEATEFDEIDFETLDAGLSAEIEPAPSMWFSFNPIPLIDGAEHWLQKQFLWIPHELGKLAVRDDRAVLRTWYKNNRFCPQRNREQLERYKLTNPTLYKMWALGEFTTLRGAILSNWDVVDSVPEGVEFLGYGLDFGYAEDPAAVVAVWRHRDELWIQQKVYADGLTNPQLSQAMEQAGMRKGIDDIVADSAEPKSIQELRDLGWLVRGADKSGRNFKRSAALYLQSRTIHVLEDSHDVRREAATWSWKKDPKQLDAEGQPKILPFVEDGNDHTIDGTIYVVFRPSSVVDKDDVSRSHSARVKPLGRPKTASSRVKAISGGRRS